jgi:hypothetical protein
MLIGDVDSGEEVAAYTEQRGELEGDDAVDAVATNTLL